MHIHVRALRVHDEKDKKQTRFILHKIFIFQSEFWIGAKTIRAHLPNESQWIWVENSNEIRGRPIADEWPDFDHFVEQSVPKYPEHSAGFLYLGLPGSIFQGKFSTCYEKNFIKNFGNFSSLVPTAGADIIRERRALISRKSGCELCGFICESRADLIDRVGGLDSGFLSRGKKNQFEFKILLSFFLSCKFF